MDKEKFNTMFGGDTEVKDQYRQMVIDCMDWELSTANTLVMLDLFCQSLLEGTELFGIELMRDGLTDLLNRILNLMGNLNNNIIEPHSKNVFEDGIDIEKYMRNNSSKINNILDEFGIDTENFLKDLNEKEGKKDE